MKNPATSKTIIENLAYGAGRSQIFHWFICNYVQFQQIASTVRIDWTQLASALADAGIKNTREQRPTPKLVKITWFRVKQHMAKRPASPEEEAQPPTERLSNDQLWSKTPTPSPEPAEAAPVLERKASTNRPMPFAPTPTTVVAQHAKPVNEDTRTPEERGQAEIDRVLAQLKARSDRRHGIF